MAEPLAAWYRTSGHGAHPGMDRRLQRMNWPVERCDLLDPQGPTYDPGQPFPGIQSLLPGAEHGEAYSGAFASTLRREIHTVDWVVTPPSKRASGNEALAWRPRFVGSSSGRDQRAVRTSRGLTLHPDTRVNLVLGAAGAYGPSALSGALGMALRPRRY